MKSKRMFSLEVVDDDAFTSMPASAQNLYFHMGMRADDDGFLNNALGIARKIHSTEDDLSILIMKGFVIKVGNRIMIITHWKKHNKIPYDKYVPTIYQQEKKMLEINQQGMYYLPGNEGSNYIDVESSYIVEKQPEKKQCSAAKIARKKKIKDGTLPYSFDAKIKNAFNGKVCPLCHNVMILGDDKFKPSVLHNTPLSQGGEHELNNISVICISCNTSALNRTPQEPINTELVAELWFGIIGIGKTNDNGFGIQSHSIDLGSDTNPKWVRIPDSNSQIENTLESSILKDFEDENCCPNEFGYQSQMGSDTNPTLTQTQTHFEPNTETQTQTQSQNFSHFSKVKNSQNSMDFEANKHLGSESLDIDIDINKKEIIKEKSSNPKAQPIFDVECKNTYGEFENVFLTDAEYEKLKSQYPDYELQIEKLSCHIESTGKKYQNHYATIKTWNLRKETDKDSSQSDNKNKWASSEERSYDFEQLEKDILSN